MHIRFILLFLIPFSIYSQRICEIGDYNYIFNTISGVEKYNYSSITLFDSINNKKLIEYKFNKCKRLKSSVFTNEGVNMNLLENSPCYLRNKLKYKYLEKNNISITNIKQDTVKELVIIKYNKKHKYKKIISNWIEVDFEYKNEKIYKINRTYFTLTYFWKNNLISKINIVSRYSYPTRNRYLTRNIIFFYEKNRLKKVEGLFAKGKATYFYDSDKLIRIKFERRGKVIFHEFNYLNNNTIITNTDQFGKYLSHYECRAPAAARLNRVAPLLPQE